MDTTYLDSPVFICGHRKTGTTMLINLFDGADDAVVFPDDSTFFYMYYPRFDSDKYSIEEKKRRMVDVMIGEVHANKVSKANCSESERKKLEQGLKQYQEFFENYQGGDYDLKSVLQRFIQGYNEAFSKVESPKVWIEKTTSTEIYAQELARIFPKAKFIHIVRDPRDNWGSLKSGWEKRYQHFNDEENRLKQSLLERGDLGMKMGKLNAEVLGEDRYRLLRFEDLTSDPKTYMKELASFIGINYSETMEYPSTFGFPWKGNNFEGVKHDKPSTVNVARWRERISDSDAKLIEFHYREEMKYFGYALEFSVAEQVEAAAEHYKWFNFSSPFSAK